MSSTLLQLLTPTSFDDQLTATIAKLASKGVAGVYSWHSGSMPKAIVENDAEALADLTLLLVQITSGGFLHETEEITDTTAREAWVELVAENVYQETRTPALFTSGDVVLSCAATAGPYTITAGVHAVQHGADPSLIYNATTGGTLASGGTLPITVKAESPGVAYNAANLAITGLVTSLPGVTVSNPGPGGGATWITSAGADKESIASLVARCEAKWASLAMGYPSVFYSYWARKAAATVTKVLVLDDNPGGPGTIWTYLANNAGAATGGEVSAVQTELDLRIPKTILHTAKPAVDVVVDIVATIKVPATYYAAAAAELASSIPAFFAETEIAGSAGGTLEREELIDVLWVNGKVTGLDVTSPAADVPLAQGEKAQLGTVTLTWVQT